MTGIMHKKLKMKFVFIHGQLQKKEKILTLILT
jgi:hypothetical protein